MSEFALRQLEQRVEMLEQRAGRASSAIAVLGLALKESERGKALDRRASVLDMLKAFIAANPGCSRKEAAEAIGHGYPYVSRLVQRLVKERVVLDEGRAWGLRMPGAEPRRRS